MIRDIPKPEISPSFTIEDIHKIREWHYEILIDATLEERADYYNNGANEALDAMAKLKREKKLAVS